MKTSPHSAKKDGNTFLVVEDNADDAVLIRMAFKAIDGHRAFVCRNISEAKAYLHGAGLYRDRGEYPFPIAIICDLRLGGDSGVHFVEWLKEGEFKGLPVSILTGLDAPHELAAAKELGAVEALRKPKSVEDLSRMLAELALKVCRNGRD